MLQVEIGKSALLAGLYLILVNLGDAVSLRKFPDEVYEGSLGQVNEHSIVPQARQEFVFARWTISHLKPIAQFQRELVSVFISSSTLHRKEIKQ